MATLWTPAGGGGVLVGTDGKPIVCDDCPCPPPSNPSSASSNPSASASGSPGGTGPSCIGCAGLAPSYWIIKATISGMGPSCNTLVNNSEFHVPVYSTTGGNLQYILIQVIGNCALFGIISALIGIDLYCGTGGVTLKGSFTIASPPIYQQSVYIPSFAGISLGNPADCINGFNFSATGNGPSWFGDNWTITCEGVA
jgi:hypothetical protein